MTAKCNDADRTYGWDRAEWERVSGFQGIGAGLPAFRPGCGALNVAPGTIEDLLIRFEETGLSQRAASNWARMRTSSKRYSNVRLVRRLGRWCRRTRKRAGQHAFTGTSRDPKEVVGICPPNNGVLDGREGRHQRGMAGCKPEYLPVVLAAVEAALDPAFSMHGVLATTMFVGPVLVVNGSIRRQIAMNGKGNALGQGNRANATIGRAVQLIIRNVGGGRPLEVDRATLGNPGKYTYCFAEDEEGSCWEPLSVERGVASWRLGGHGFRGIWAARSSSIRSHADPESLSRSMAESLKAIHNVKLAPACDAMLVVCPEHERTFRDAGWSKARLYEELYRLCEIRGETLVSGARGIAEGYGPSVVGTTRNKFRPGGLLIVRCAGGGAGMFSGIIGGWSLRRRRRLFTSNQGGESVTVLLDPTSEQNPVSRERLTRPDRLAGLTVGLLDISKPRGDVFLDRLDACC